nr:MAG TPA: hypothetical protein [Caudoviricetes sp.]
MLQGRELHLHSLRPTANSLKRRRAAHNPH